MTVRTYEKDGDITNCFRQVKEIKVMFVSGRCKEGLLNLNMTFKDGSELDYYLSENERFATIKDVVYE